MLIIFLTWQSHGVGQEFQFVCIFYLEVDQVIIKKYNNVNAEKLN